MKNTHTFGGLWI